MPDPVTMSAGAAAGQGAASAAGGIFSAIANIGAAKKAHKRNLELWEKDKNWNLEQWHRQNAYNDPSAQMERMKAAGINPNLAFGKSAGAGVAGPVPQSARPVAQPRTFNLDTAQAVASFQQARMQEVQIDAAQDQRETSAANRRLMDAQTLLTLSKGKITDQQRVQASQAFAGQLHAQKLANQNSYADLMGKRTQQDYMRLSQPANLAKLSAEVQVLQQQLKNMGLDAEAKRIANDFNEWKNARLKSGRPMPGQESIGEFLLWETGAASKAGNWLGNALKNIGKKATNKLPPIFR